MKKLISIKGLDNGQCKVIVDGDVIYQGTQTQQSLKDVINPVLQEFPDIKINTANIKPTNKDWLHIFKVRGETTRAFARTHDEVPDPFRNRKLYQMVNPQHTVSFKSIDL